MPQTMAAIAITPGTKDSARLLEMPRPEPGPTEVLVRVLQIGIDGTDRELNAGLYGEAPSDSRYLVIGHESLGRVVEVGSAAQGVGAGDLVVATVRRPCAGNCPNCARGYYDACSTGDYRERGIRGLHGYLAEYYAEDPRFLVRIPPGLAHVAVLLEPLSIVEKILSDTFEIQRRIAWTPRTALVLGTGCIGLLAAMLLRLRGFDTYTLARAPESHLKACLAREIGATYLRHNDPSLQAVAGRMAAKPDFVLEATGFSRFTFEAIPLLAINGVLAISGVSGGKSRMEVPCEEWTMHLVLGNRVVFGCVNSSVPHFERAAAHLRDIEQKWPGILQRMITRRLRIADFAEALAGELAAGIKTVVEAAEEQ